MNPSDMIPLSQFDAIIVSPFITVTLSFLWLLAFGGCVGSFMNVVVYRVPAGRSVVHPGSRCPQCDHAIRSYDNIPVMSWLILRGKCRDCGVEISSRYPLVEALVAGVFVLIAWFEPLSDGNNLPTTYPNFRIPQLMLWSLYATHVLVLSTFICSALIAFDGHRVSWKFFVPPSIMAVAMCAVWSEHRTLFFAEGRQVAGWPFGLGYGLLSFATGAVSGCVVWLFTRHEKTGFLAIVWGTALCGATFGWQAVPFIVVPAVVIFLIARLLSRSFAVVGYIPWFGFLTFFACAFIILWRPIESLVGRVFTTA